MKRIRQIPLVCLLIAIVNLLTGRLILSNNYLGTEVRNDNGDSFNIFRNIKNKKGKQNSDSCVFVVSFKFAHLSHSLNKLTSIIPMLLIAGFPGFKQKIYAVNKQNGYWQGMYEWKSKQHLEAYKKSFVYRMMNKRAIAESIKTKDLKNSRLINLILEKMIPFENKGNYTDIMYNVIPNTKCDYSLIQCKAADEIELINFLNLIESLGNITYNNKNLKIILDFRNSHMNYPISQQLKIVEPFCEQAKEFSSIRIAEIVNRPRETSYATLFKIEVKNFSNLRFEIFSTMDAALDWLNIN